MTNLNIHLLRRWTLVGLAVVIFVDLILSWRMHSGLGLGSVVLLVSPLGVGLVSLVLMPRAAGILLRNLDLLVPLGLMLVAGKLLDWLTAAPLLGALLGPALPLRIFNLSIGLSFNFVLRLALAGAYATWTTAAVLALVQAGTSDPCRVLPMDWNRFWRVLGLEFIGWAAVMLATASLLLLLPVMGFFALVPMLLFAVAWNFATAAMLPVAWQEASGFSQIFRNGVATSLANIGRWWPLLLAQMLLLGLVFFYYSSGGGNTNTSFSVNVFWTGGYENDCRWYGKLAEVFHTAKLPLVETLLMILFGTFAVAIKVAIVQRLQSEPSPALPSETPTTETESGQT